MLPTQAALLECSGRPEMSVFQTLFRGERRAGAGRREALAPSTEVEPDSTAETLSRRAEEGG